MSLSLSLSLTTPFSNCHTLGFLVKLGIVFVVFFGSNLGIPGLFFGFIDGKLECVLSVACGYCCTILS